MQEMLNDLKIENKKFLNITEITQKYVIYFAQKREFSIKLAK